MADNTPAKAPAIEMANAALSIAEASRTMTHALAKQPHQWLEAWVDLFYSPLVPNGYNGYVQKDLVIEGKEETLVRDLASLEARVDNIVRDIRRKKKSKERMRQVLIAFISNSGVEPAPDEQEAGKIANELLGAE